MEPQSVQDLVLRPAIFEGVDRVRSMFSLAGELCEDNPLGNNMSVVDSVVREGLQLIGVHEEYLDVATSAELERATRRRWALAFAAGTDPLIVACPRPVAGADIVYVNDDTIDKLSSQFADDRPRADIAIIAEAGYGSLIAPADCPVIDIVDPNTGGEVAQCHAGWQGILAGAVVNTMTALTERGMNPAHALVNIHPNATDGFELRGEGLERWIEAFDGDFMYVENGRSYISMTGAAIAQLAEAGIQQGRIQTSAAYSSSNVDLNSLTDDRFYSHRARTQKGFTGRNAAILVRVSE